MKPETRTAKLKALFPIKGKADKDALREAMSHRTDPLRCPGAITLAAALKAAGIKGYKATWVVLTGNIGKYNKMGEFLGEIRVRCRPIINPMDLKKPKVITFYIPKDAQWFDYSLPKQT